MNKKRTIGFLILALTLIHAEGGREVRAQGLSDMIQGATPREPDIPKEPGWRDPSYRGWELLNIPGLIATYYDLDTDGKLDYMVIRKIMRKTSSEEISTEQALQIAQYDKLAVYFSNPVIYFTNRNPLFYCLGVDYRKNCRDIWVDVAEDGLNGNEELYTLATPRPHVQ